MTQPKLAAFKETAKRIESAQNVTQANSLADMENASGVEQGYNRKLGKAKLMSLLQNDYIVYGKSKHVFERDSEDSVVRSIEALKREEKGAEIRREKIQKAEALKQEGKAAEIKFGEIQKARAEAEACAK